MIEGPRPNPEIPSGLTIGRTLSALRRREGRISQQELAERSKISQKMLGHIEYDTRIPSPLTIVDIGNALGISPSQIDTLLLIGAHTSIAKAREATPVRPTKLFEAAAPINTSLPDENLGRMYHELRDRTGLSQEGFAKLCGISKSLVDKIERDQKIPKPVTVADICDGIGIPQTDPIRDILLLKGAHQSIKEERNFYKRRI